MPRKKKRLRLERLEARNLLAVEAVTLPGVHFANPVVYEPEIPSSQVTSAIYHDLNGDGNRDVIFGHDTGVSVALSLREGRFDGHPTVFDLEEPTWHLAARDINQDGVVDLVAGGSSKVFVLLGQANKDAWTGFEVASTINAETNSIELGDVDQDGKVDLVLARSSAVVYSGTGTGEFNNPIHYGSAAETAELADVDSDGDLDLITASQQAVTVFRNDGGIFETEVDSISVTSDRPYLALGDVDDDGSLDLWVSHGSAEHSLVDLYRGNGDGTFNTNRLSIETLGLAKDVQFADINGDSRTDLVIGHWDTFHHPINGNGPGGVSIALANETGSFHSPIRISANTPHAVIVEDMNDDGTSDVASVAYNKFQTFHQRATDLFAPEVQSFQVSSFGPIQSAVGDINGDSMMDIAIATFDSATDETEIRVSFGANNGTFTEKSLTVMGRVSHIEIANFDSDDNHELTVVVLPFGAVAEKGISVFELDESGEFRDPKTTPTASSFFTQETFDANADGIQDFLGTHGQTTAVMLGTANGHFELMNLSAVTSDFRPPILADFNQDQVTDILLVASNAFIVFLGNNDGTYTESFRQSVPSRTPIHVGEFDGDGNLDIVTAVSAEEEGFVYYGQGDGSFMERQAFPTIANSVLYVTDMNNDGMSDLLYETGEKIQLLINRGSSWRDVGEYWLAESVENVQAIDVDGDGKKETVLTPGPGFSYPQANITIIDDIEGEDLTADITTYSVSNTILSNLSVQDVDKDGSPEFIVQSLSGFFIAQPNQTPALPCDFDNSGACDLVDLDALLYEGLSNQAPVYDLDASGTVDLADRDAFLVQTDSLPGDFNMDGINDAADLNTLGLGWLRNVTSYADGDADGDGVVDAADLNVLGLWWQKTASGFADASIAAASTERATLGVDNVVINEIMYHPATGNSLHEFIELYNPTDESADVTGWKISNGVEFTFPAVSIPANGYLTVAADVDALTSQYADIGRVVGGWTGRLANRGEVIEVVDANGQVVDRVRYADEGEWSSRVLAGEDHGFRGWKWDSPHDGSGSTLELVNVQLDNGTGQNWLASEVDGGTPGRANSVADSNSPPILTAVRHFPPIPSSDDTVHVYVNVADEADDVSVNLLYRVSGMANFISVPMTVSDELDGQQEGYVQVTAEIPPLTDKTIVEFRIVAIDSSGLSRVAPGFAADEPDRYANFLYQVLDDAPTTQNWEPSDQPVTLLIMLPSEFALLSDIGDGPLDEAESNAAMNATFIRVDGNGTDVRYQVGIRNRGGSSRIGPPNNYRLNISHDQPWDGKVSVNLNSRYIHSQILGSVIYQLAGLPAADALAAKVLVNGEDLAEAEGPLMFGSYAQLETVTGSFPDNHFPDDRRGNLYRAVASGTGSADLTYLGPEINAYQQFYSKRTNEELDDWSDLIRLTRVLSETSEDEFVAEVNAVLDVDQWLRFLALDSLLGNREVGLALGSGDNYWLYRGTIDTRFQIIPHDLDTILGRARLGEPNRSIFAYTDVPGLQKLLTHPDIVPRYYQAYLDLMSEVYNPETLFPLFDRVLGGFVSADELDEMRQFVLDRMDGVLAQLPQEFTITSDLPTVNGIHRTTIPAAELVGTADALRTKTVLVKGQQAEWSPFSREWSFRTTNAGESKFLVEFGDDWKYLDDGSNQQATWRQIDLDDTEWSSGPAPLGYGNDDESTIVGFGPNRNNKFITTYFRHAFEIDDASEVRDLTLRLQRDDGAIVFLNNQEVARSNMPSGDVDFQTVASTWVGGGLESRIESFSVDPSLLVQGMNLLSVEVHQRSAIDDDIRLDLSLEATVGAIEGGVPLLPGINRIEVATLESQTTDPFNRDFIDIWYDGAIGKDTNTCSSFLMHGEMAPAIIDAGTIQTDTVLAPCGPAYRVTGEVVVPAGVTLSVMPGTTVFFDDGAGLTFDGGRMVAEGTKYEPVRFTRSPASDGTWEGIQFINSMTDNRLSQAIVEHAVTANGMVGLRNSELTIDSVTFQNSDRFRIRTVDSSLVVRNSTFADIFPGNQPPTTDNRSEHIWGSGIAENGQLLIEANHFGTTKGHNDAIDFDGAQLPGPIPVIQDNYFAGSGDDAIDLESDAFVVGNTFMNVVKDAFNTATGDANAISAGAGREYFVARNVFSNVDHAVQVKDDALLTFRNNTVSQVNVSAIYFDLPDRTPGKGAIITDSIFHKTAQTIGAAEQAKILEVHRSIVAPDALQYGNDNLVANPRFVEETKFDFRLRPGSPAVETGRSGIDRGALVDSRIVVGGLPEAFTHHDSVRLDLWGPEFTVYRYRLNQGEWSDDFDLEQPLDLSSLGGGPNRLEILAQNIVGKWQDVDEATVAEWIVDSSRIDLRINEVLAKNTSAYEQGGSYPDAVELFNASGVRIDLSGMRLTDDPSRPLRFVFPPDTFIEPDGYLVLAADEQQGPLSLDFGLDANGEGIYLYNTDGSEIDSITFGVQASDYSIGRVGRLAEWSLTLPTIGEANTVAKTGDAENLTINEWFADPGIQFDDDYVELYNADSLPVALTGLFMTDDAVSRPRQHEFATLSFVGPQGFAVLQADGRGDRGPDHLSFRLDATGESVSLFDGHGALIDSVIFFEQTGDWAEGRSPDGHSQITSQRLATPGMPNVVFETLEKTILDWNGTWAVDQSQTDWGTDWLSADFDDAAWERSTGIFAVGTEQLPVVIGSELQPNVLTGYFRSTFDLDDEVASRLDMSEFAMSLLVDDGAAVYVNGTEVLRIGLPDGALSINTRANRGVSSVAVEGPFVVPLSVFQPGQNHIAVELHQISPASTDAVFGLTLISHTDITDPAIHGAGRLLDGLRVSEIMYHPEADEDLEFIELANVSDQVIDLSNVRIRGGVTFDFSEIQLAPDQRTVVVRDRIRFEQTYGPSISIAGQYAGNLSNRSDSIRLLLPLAFGGAIVDFSYHDHWYPSTDGDGRSLVARDLRAPRQVWRNASQWEASNLIGGSPGRPESTVSPDFDGDGRVDIRDVELLCSEIRGGEHNQALDLNGDAIVDNADMAEMITQFIGTRTGDANLDGHVDALDLNQVGKHWLQASDELTWAKGNFNCDNTVDALDLNQVGMHWQFGATARTPRAPLATRTVIQDNLVDVVMADVAHAVRSQPHIP